MISEGAFFSSLLNSSSFHVNALFLTFPTRLTVTLLSLVPRLPLCIWVGRESGDETTTLLCTHIACSVYSNVFALWLSLLPHWARCCPKYNSKESWLNLSERRKAPDFSESRYFCHLNKRINYDKKKNKTVWTLHYNT